MFPFLPSTWLPSCWTSIKRLIFSLSRLRLKKKGFGSQAPPELREDPFFFAPFIFYIFSIFFPTFWGLPWSLGVSQSSLRSALSVPGATPPSGEELKGSRGSTKCSASQAIKKERGFVNSACSPRTIEPSFFGWSR